MEGEFPVCPEPRVKGGGWDRCGVRGRGGGGKDGRGKGNSSGRSEHCPGGPGSFFHWDQEASSAARSVTWGGTLVTSWCGPIICKMRGLGWLSRPLCVT